MSARHPRWPWVLAAAAFGALSACVVTKPVEAGAATGAAAPAAPAAPQGARPRSGFVGGPGSAAASLEALHAAILADAAAGWGAADPAVLRVAQSEAITWPNGALGCPQPGVQYTQALVPGWRLVVRDGSGQRELVYHASRRGAWLWCPPARATRPVPGAGMS